MIDTPLTDNEKKTLSVLAFLFFRMGMEERARRFYEVLAELSSEGSSDRRFALAGLAAVSLESGDAESALRNIREAISMGPISTRDATMYLLLSRSLWALDRKDEALVARDEFLRLRGHVGESQ